MTAGGTHREQRAFAAVPLSAREARLFVTDSLRSRGADAGLISDYQLVVSELTANVIEHGDGTDLMVIVDHSDPEWWEVEVADGPPKSPSMVLRPNDWAVADASKLSGRGLGIVRHLMDDIVIKANDGRLSVRCRRRRIASLPT